MTFEEAVERYGKFAGLYAKLYCTRGVLSHDELYQAGLLILWNRLDYVSRIFEDEGEDVAARRVNKMLKVQLGVYMKAERMAFEYPGEDGRAKQLGMMSELDTAKLGDAEPVPVQGIPGPEAEWTEDSEALVIREVVAAVNRLEPGKRDVLRDVFVDGMTQAEAAEKRGVTQQYIGAEMKRLIAAVAAELKPRLREPGPKVPLHSGFEGYGSRA